MNIPKINNFISKYNIDSIQNMFSKEVRINSMDTGYPRRNAKGKHFRINNTKYVMCIVTIYTITHDLFRY